MKRWKLFLAKPFYNWLYSLRGWDEVATNNYGFAPLSSLVEREAYSEPYQIQMYQSLIEFGGLADWNKYSLLEIGCGRGGGLRYVVKAFRPKEIIGFDSAKAALTFCKESQTRFPYHISYLHGDAHNLPFESKKFDVVINVEASHIYSDLGKFFSEVARVLKDEGVCLLADYRKTNKHVRAIETLYKQAARATLVVQAERDITANITEACRLGADRRAGLIRNAPRLVQPYLRHYCALPGTRKFDKFHRKRRYYFFIKLGKRVQSCHEGMAQS
jgi:SAM-dependent methyltransferase